MTACGYCFGRLWDSQDVGPDGCVQCVGQALEVRTCPSSGRVSASGSAHRSAELRAPQTQQGFTYREGLFALN